MSSYSSINTRRGRTLHDDIDRSVYAVGQTLASIVNDPRSARQAGSSFWGLGADVGQPSAPPPLDPAKYPPVTRADVAAYIELVHGAYERFMRDRQSLEAFDAQRGSDDASGLRAHASQGEPFMAAVQAVPMQFFQENFDEHWDEFFKAYCTEQSADELYEQIDGLNKSLDVVELQLLREVAARSGSFFEAAAGLQDLLGLLADSLGTIKGLRGSLAEADEAMYSTAVAVKALQARRSNLQATLDITKGLEEVVAAQAALDVMLQGQDYPGALELLEQMGHLLEAPALAGLTCVRHLPPRIADTTAHVEGCLARELLAALANANVARVVAAAASDAEAQPDASVAADGAASLWQLPGAPEPDVDGSGAASLEQLQERLLPLALGLYRADRLAATLQQYKQSVAEEVKAAVRSAVHSVLPVLLAAGGDVGGGQLLVGASSGEAALADQLQQLHHGAFMVLLHAAARVILSCVDHVQRVGQQLEEILTGVNAPASQLASLRRDCAAALQVVVDVGLGRWVKLLSARGGGATRLKQYELKQLLDLSEQVAAHTEARGARTLGSFRSALQAQCKVLLDQTHSRATTQLTHLLESEQWVAVEVPAGLQAIVDRLLARCGEGAALLDARPRASPRARSPRTSADGGGGGGSNNAALPPAAQAPPPSSSSAAAAPSEGHAPTLVVCGRRFHLVNSGLMLLVLVDEYMGLHELMPVFGAEIVHRQLELLKLFNASTAALVLGAGAMRTAGLRSISAKQLALSCQAVGMLATLLPLLRAGCLSLVSQPRRALLIPEFDRLASDLATHVDEVHTKLVDIMRDRLGAALPALPAEIRASTTNLDAPSPTVALLVRQLSTLRGVLAPLLLREEVEYVFGSVARAYSDGLAGSFEAMLGAGACWEPVVRANALALLQAFRELPLEPTRASSACSRLSTLYTKHFGLLPWDQKRLGIKQAPAADEQQLQEPEAGEQPAAADGQPGAAEEPALEAHVAQQPADEQPLEAHEQLQQEAGEPGEQVQLAAEQQQLARGEEQQSAPAVEQPSRAAGPPSLQDEEQQQQLAADEQQQLPAGAHQPQSADGQQQQQQQLASDSGEQQQPGEQPEPAQLHAQPPLEPAALQHEQQQQEERLVEGAAKPSAAAAATAGAAIAAAGAVTIAGAAIANGLLSEDGEQQPKQLDAAEQLHPADQLQAAQQLEQPERMQPQQQEEEQQLFVAEMQQLEPAAQQQQEQAPEQLAPLEQTQLEERLHVQVGEQQLLLQEQAQQQQEQLQQASSPQPLHQPQAPESPQQLVHAAAKQQQQQQDADAGGHLQQQAGNQQLPGAAEEQQQLLDGLAEPRASNANGHLLLQQAVEAQPDRAAEQAQLADVAGSDTAAQAAAAEQAAAAAAAGAKLSGGLLVAGDGDSQVGSSAAGTAPGSPLVRVSDAGDGAADSPAAGLSPPPAGSASVGDLLGGWDLNELAGGGSSQDAIARNWPATDGWAAPDAAAPAAAASHPPAAAGDATDLLWAEEQLLQSGDGQHEPAAESSQQDSAVPSLPEPDSSSGSPGTAATAAPAAVDGNEGGVVQESLDAPPSPAAAAADADASTAGAVLADVPADAQQPADAGQEAGGTSSVPAASVVHTPSWDPLNAASEPPSAAHVEGTG